MANVEQKLLKYQELNQIIDAVTGGIIHISADGTVLRVNDEVYRIFNTTPERIRDKNIFDVNIDTFFEDGMKLGVDDYPAVKCLRSGERQGPETIGCRLTNGDVVWASYTANPLFDSETEKLTSVVVTCLDITEQKKAEQKLKELNDNLEEHVRARTEELSKANVALKASEAKWRSFTENAPDIIFNIDSAGKILLINKVVPGLTVEDTIGTYIFNYVDPEHQPILRASLKKVFEEGKPDSYETEGVGGNGTRAWYNTRVAPIVQDGVVVEATMITTDITDRINAENRVKDERERLQLMLDLQERERKLVSCEIHDGFLQDIIGAKMRLEAFYHNADLYDSPLKQDLKDIENLFQSAIGEGRRMINDLRPLILDEAGVIDAIQFLIAEISLRETLVVEFEHNDCIARLNPLLESNLFRIVQEALTNIRKHSQAENASITLSHENDTIKIVIQDTGVGFDPNQTPKRSFGMTSMQERVSLFNGTVDIDSAPNQGTTLTLEIPITSELLPEANDE